MTKRERPHIGPLARSVNEEIRSEAARRRLSGKELARRMGKSQNYVATRLRDEDCFSLDDLEWLAEFFGISPSEFVYRAETTLTSPARRPSPLMRSERVSDAYHNRLSQNLTPETLEHRTPTIERNLERLRQTVQGQPNERNLDEWQALVDSRDVAAVKSVMTGVSRHDIAMRDVTPMAGLLSDEEKIEVSRALGTW